MALLPWLAMQFIALALAASRVPLWAKYPRNGEQLALHFLIFIQLATASLLFPLLFRTLGTSAMVIAVSWPLSLLAAAVASVPMEQAGPAMLYVNCWLIGLALLQRALAQWPAAQLVGVMAVGTWVFAGPVLRYLNAEFGAAPTEFPLAGLDVMATAFAHAAGGAGSPARWLPPVALNILALLTLLLVFGWSRRRKPAQATQPG